MQELNELKNLVIQSLEANGALSNIRAQIRASVFKVVDQQDAPANQPKKPSAFSWENPKCAALLQNPHGTLILQLIKEFLQFYGMDYSNSVFSSEGNVREEVKRDKINGVLQIKELDAKKPLLLQVVEEFYKKGEKSDSTVAEAGNSEDNKEKDAAPAVQADKPVEKQSEVKQQQQQVVPQSAEMPKVQQNKLAEAEEAQGEEVPQSQVDPVIKQETIVEKPAEQTEQKLQQQLSKSNESTNKVKTGESEKNDGEGESARGKKALEAVEKFIQKNQDQLKSGEIASLPVTASENQADKQATPSGKTQGQEQQQSQQTQQQQSQQDQQSSEQQQQQQQQQQNLQPNGQKYDSEEFDQYEEEGVEEQLEQYQYDEEYNEEDYQHGHYASDTHEKAEESEDFIGQSSKGHDISVDSYELENFDYITDVEDL